MGLKQIARLVKNATIEKDIPDQFLDDLESTMQRISLKESRKPSQTYKPSSLGGCKRNMFFQVTGAEPDPDEPDSPSLIGICESGSNRHVEIQTWVSRMKEAGFDCEWVDVGEWIKSRKPEGTIVKNKSGMETKCYNEILNVSFLCDGVIRYKGHYYILEIKTEDHFKYTGQVKPFDKHEVQATAYSVCLGIDDIIFLYEDRNYCIKKPYLFHITQEMKQDLVIAEIEEVEGYRREGKVPPKSTKSADCRYCSYKKECRKWG